MLDKFNNAVAFARNDIQPPIDVDTFLQHLAHIAAVVRGSLFVCVACWLLGVANAV